ncbi:DAN domain family member 5-like [Chrysoperla carnea]|uniref:DAN domain family member 5-like n=1 Tax=Chrysoperla carnea TaxID=189513 RepID=UPI001D064D65|nr:DAN domain family member 5-like [Chrysoperla carnea]
MSSDDDDDDESSSPSILDIINTKKVEMLLAERRQNASREEKRYLELNNLDDNYTPNMYGSASDNDNHLSSEISHQPVDSSKRTRIDVNMLLRKNSNTSGFPKTELLSDLTGYEGIKLLKSSRSALLVTKKEYLKKDWCKTEPLVQKIREEGCLTRTIINRFCYGQCNSFYIPKSPKKRRPKHFGHNLDESEDDDLNGAAFKSCEFCRPKKFTWITITLRCPTKIPQLRKKRIQRIKQCKCTAESL